MPKPLTIAITGLDTKQNPYPGPAVARSLRDDPEFRDARVIGLTYDVGCTGNYRTDLFDAIFMSAYPSDSESLIMSRIGMIHDEDPIDVLIPALDTEIATFARLASRLEGMGIRTLLPSEEVIKARQKANLFHLGQQVGLDVPRTVVLNSDKQLKPELRGMAYPVVVKGCMVDAIICHDEEEAEAAYRRMLREWGYPVLLQERVAGEEFDVAMVCDADHEIVGMVPMKKFGISDQGKAFSGVTIEYPELAEWARMAAKKLRWVGPAELEVMRLFQDNSFAIMEINARFPAWIYLSAAAGCNLPAAAVRLALGRDPGPLDPEYGKLFFRNTRAMITNISDTYTNLVVTGKTSYAKELA